MISTLINRRNIAGLTSAGVLMLAALATAPQADAATFYACVKKDGTAHIFTKKPKCKKHETKLSWNATGPAGTNGTNGTHGSNGTNGTNGSNGNNGADLTSHTPLPTGQSESGWFAIGTGSSTSGEGAEGISFSQPLAAPLPTGHAVYNLKEETSAHCPGFGHAAPGYLCLYAAEQQNLIFTHTLNFPPYETNSVARYGFALYFEVESSFGYVDGSWTVTAP